MLTKVLSIIAAGILLMVALQYLLRPHAIQRQHLTEQTRHPRGRGWKRGRSAKIDRP